MPPPWQMLDVFRSESESKSSRRESVVGMESTSAAMLRMAGRAHMRQPLRTSAQEAIRRVIVHQPGGLHIGIDDRAADKAEATILEIL